MEVVGHWMALDNTTVLRPIEQEEEVDDAVDRSSDSGSEGSDLYRFGKHGPEGETEPSDSGEESVADESDEESAEESSDESAEESSDESAEESSDESSPHESGELSPPSDDDTESD